MKDILDLTVNGISIGEIPEFLKREMTDEEFREFNKFPSDDHEESIEEVVRFLKEQMDK